jgi:hypothetical protein
MCSKALDRNEIVPFESREQLRWQRYPSQEIGALIGEIIDERRGMHAVIFNRTQPISPEVDDLRGVGTVHLIPQQ